MKRTLLITAILVLFIEATSIYAKPARRLHLTRKDKAQVIESVLRKESVKKEFVQADKVYLLQNEILTPDLVPEVFKDRILVIDREELKAKKENEAEVLYFSFLTFE